MDEPIIHLYVNAHLGCGRKVAYTRLGPNTKFTADASVVSCRKCARNAPGLSDLQRQEIWDNANARLDSEAISPWEKAAKQTSRREASVGGV